MYERPADGEEHEVYWLQPGGITVGAQTFPPFAYFENTEASKRLQRYTVSTMDQTKVSSTSTIISILLTLAGYILQLIALRGMVAYVSIAQLAVTIF